MDRVTLRPMHHTTFHTPSQESMLRLRSTVPTLIRNFQVENQPHATQIGSTALHLRGEFMSSQPSKVWTFLDLEISYLQFCTWGLGGGVGVGGNTEICLFLDVGTDTGANQYQRGW